MNLQGQQPDDQQKRKRKPKRQHVVRFIIFITALIFFIGSMTVAILSSDGSWFNIISVGFAALAIIVGILQWLFPTITRESESSGNSSDTSLQRQIIVQIPTAHTAILPSSAPGGVTYRGIAGLPPPIDPRTIQQRVSLVEDVYNKLIQPDITAITLTGIGGVGKSTLAALIYHYAAEPRPLGSKPYFDEPIWLTINDNVTMIDLVGSLFEILNIPLPDLGNLAPQSLAVVLFKALNTTEKPRLVILDQFENLLNWQTGYALEDRPGVGEWLDAINSQQCRSRILMTSRPWPKGTREYPPTYMQEYQVKGLGLEEGTELLQKQGISAGETELHAVVELCQGHAFSLMLLASLLRDYKLNLATLFGDQKYAQIWTGNIAYNLLDRIYSQRLNSIQRNLLIAFSVYREPMPLEAALVIIDLNTQTLNKQIPPALHTLLAQHLLQAVGEGRYQLHAIVSSYAQAHFFEDNEEANRQSLIEAYRKAAQYYISQANIHCPPREKRQQISDIQPLIEAIWHLCQAEQWEQADELMQQEHIFNDLFHWGGHATLLEIYQLMLSSKTWQMRLLQAARVYNNLGEIYMILGKMELALKSYKQALPIYQKMKDREGEGWVLNNIGRAYNPLGDKEQVLHYAEQAVQILRDVGDHDGMGTALCNIGWAYYDKGQMKSAREYFEQALVVFEEAGAHKEGRTLYSIGRIYADLDVPTEARHYYERALVALRTVNDRAGEGIVLSNLGRLYEMPGQKEAALRYIEQARSILKEVGDRSAEGWALKCLGRVYYDLKEIVHAKECYEQSYAILKEVKDLRGEGRALNNLGMISELQNQQDQAVKYYAESLSILKKVGDRWGESKAMWNISLFFFKQCRYDVALACFLLTRIIFDEVETPDRAKLENYVERLHKEIGDEQFKALFAKVEPQAQQIVALAL